jgi:hypothetical protein
MPSSDHPTRRPDLPVVAIEIRRLPTVCANCGARPRSWPLSYGGFRVALSCGTCHTLIAEIAAVEPPPDDGSRPDMIP